MNFTEEELKWRSEESREIKEAKMHRLLEQVTWIIKKEYEKLDFKIGDTLDFAYFYYEGMPYNYNLSPLEVKLFFHYYLTKYRLIVSDKSNLMFEIVEIYPEDLALANHKTLTQTQEREFKVLPDVIDYYRLN
ncbi:hypothetical protein ACR79T_10115 [Sphingobacterium spiritivorum]|uniref:hypothetical protein n=1 Tax=Sphingobacterium spiritivorum TaxID=258 RepID=UPI003DA3EACA